MAPKRAAASAPPHFSTPLYHTFPRLGTAPAPNLLSGNNSLPLGTFQHQPGHGPQAPRLRRGRRASPAGAVLPDGPACGPPSPPRPPPASHKPRPAGGRPPGGCGGLRPPARGSAPRPCGPHPHHSHQVQSSLSPPDPAALRRPAAAPAASSLCRHPPLPTDGQQQAQQHHRPAAPQHPPHGKSRHSCPRHGREHRPFQPRRRQ